MSRIRSRTRTRPRRRPARDVRIPPRVSKSIGPVMTKIRLLVFLACGFSLGMLPARAQQPTSKVVVDLGPKRESYDGYVRNMMSSIQGRWSRIRAEDRTTSPSGTLDAVRFTMDSRGRITKILDVGNTSSEPGEQCCITALTTAAPFGVWTDDMRSKLGNSQDLTVRFCCS